jgi:hypothetical protein
VEKKTEKPNKNKYNKTIWIYYIMSAYLKPLKLLIAKPMRSSLTTFKTAQLYFYYSHHSHHSAMLPLWQLLTFQLDGKIYGRYRLNVIAHNFNLCQGINTIASIEDNLIIKKQMELCNISRLPTIRLVFDGNVVDYDFTQKLTSPNLKAFLMRLLL